MANVNFTQGLKMVGDRASGVSGAAAAIAGMSVDDDDASGGTAHTGFLAADTTLRNGGTAGPTLQGNALDSTPTGGSAASPYVTSHLMTLTTSQFNGQNVNRIALHNTNAPTATTTSVMFGIDGLALAKASSFSLITTFKLSYT